ncbi:hypothetical protein K1T71_000092 [Dendrolimus kikuchii]|uniref:Uncharacterized protein n=1 Tax=Dendrolimus kikuchii TaxID=765133 RepID=A0ACC1DIW8_9NEOP|nr:hypothetical protein K1T71_000092 [Dendrolimus kikuchii]
MNSEELLMEAFIASFSSNSYEIFELQEQQKTFKSITSACRSRTASGVRQSHREQFVHDSERVRTTAPERGIMSRLTALVAFVVLLQAFVRAEHQFDVCKLPYCDCQPAAHPSWTTVNCTVPRDKNLDILDGDLPDNTVDLVITGGEAVMFGSNSLSRLKDCRQIRVSGPKLIALRKLAAVNLNVVSAYLDIDTCDVLRIEERTFSNIKGPLSVTINNCETVSIEGDAFSWLLNMNITDVRKLDLGQGAFMLDPTAANVGDHGPGMTIEIKNSTIPEIAAQTFGSSAAKVSMKSTEILAIRPGAFTANTYNSVIAVNCSFHLIEEGAFASHSLIYNLQFTGCKIHQMAPHALQSAVSNLNISRTRFENIATGAINATVASIVILDSEFKIFNERGFEFGSYNKLIMERNSFDNLPPHAIVAMSPSIHELTFIENEIETIHPQSLEFIGQAHAAHKITYKSNYYGQPCHCNITQCLAQGLSIESGTPYENESFCTVNEFFARCFNEPEQNMLFKKFLRGVCNEDLTVHCEAYKSTIEGHAVEIKNPRFPHKTEEEEEGLSDRDKKIIGIVVVTCLACVIIAMFVSFIRCLRRRGYCTALKNMLVSSNSSCGSFCERLCPCGRNSGTEDTPSISQVSVHEYSERHRLNEPCMREIIQESNLHDELVPTEDKTTQTLPEELTRELLENLREKLDSPVDYMEAREMIEHLYELTKMEESYHPNIPPNTPTLINVEENIYELPFQNTTPRVGKNKAQMVSVGTRTPSLDKLLPLSPYNRQPALAHEYFEPRDMAVHLYAEIANNDREKRTLLSNIPDVIAEQAVPRGPYLLAVREKMIMSPPTSPSYSITSSIGSPRSFCTTRSDRSTTSNSSSSKMANRPLPEKPAGTDPGEGTSFNQG